MELINRPILLAIKCAAYNHEPYIRQCLDGFVMQKTNFRFVAIVHDDASTDGTADIIREYERKYPDIIIPIYETENQYSKSDGSLGRIMNTAVDATGAKYVALCEGDDYWIDPLKLQKQVDFMEKHPDYSMCFHKAKIENELTRNVSCRMDLIDQRDYSANELFTYWIVPTASIICKKTVFDYPTYGDERILNGDIILVLKSLEQGKVRAFDSEMSVYRMHSGGVTYDKRLQYTRMMRYPMHYEFIKDNFTCLDEKLVHNAMMGAILSRFRHRKDLYGKITDLKTIILKDSFYIFKYLWNKIFKK